jgi:HAD superfamily hydrolase (TIGR01549 family)
MKYEAILFDLDGTLLPMDNDEFLKYYFDLLAKNVAHLGYTKEILIPTMWKGVAAMVKNDGSRSNYDVFWEVFSGIVGDHVYEHIPTFDRFYSNDFNQTAVITKPTPLAQKAVDLAKEKAGKVILATNPMFPAVAVQSRLGWANVTPDSFDLITTYENSGTCKPNPAYYLEIASKMNVDPKNCLMIGNNADEDVRAAASVGMDTFLLTDYLICDGELPETPKGNFEELIVFLQNI